MPSSTLTLFSELPERPAGRIGPRLPVMLQRDVVFTSNQRTPASASTVTVGWRTRGISPPSVQIAPLKSQSRLAVVPAGGAAPPRVKSRRLLLVAAKIEIHQVGEEPPATVVGLECAHDGELEAVYQLVGVDADWRAAGIGRSTRRTAQAGQIAVEGEAIPPGGRRRVALRGLGRSHCRHECCERCEHPALAARRTSEVHALEVERLRQNLRRTLHRAITDERRR